MTDPHDKHDETEAEMRQLKRDDEKAEAREPHCCDGAMKPLPQYIEPGHKMYEVTYGRGAPIYMCMKCCKTIWSEGMTTGGKP